MNNNDQIKQFLSMFVMYLPTLIVCLVAGGVILTRWRQASSGALWALLGFGLALFLCFAMPIGLTMINHWVFQSGETQSRIWALRTFSMVGSVLYAVIYAFLLVAIFAGRSKPEAQIAPPLNEP